MNEFVNSFPRYAAFNIFHDFSRAQLTNNKNIFGFLREITSLFRDNTSTRIYAYSIFISVRYMTPKINHVVILFQFCLSREQRSLDLSSANVLFP